MCPCHRDSTSSKDIERGEERLSANGDPVGESRIRLIDSAVESVDQGVLIVDDTVLVILTVEHRAGVGVQFKLDVDGARAMVGYGLVLGDVLVNALIPDLADRAARREGPHVAQERFLFTANVGFEHRVHAGRFPVALIRTRSGRTGGNLVGVIADAVVEVVLSEFGPQRLELISGQTASRSRNWLVEQDRGDSTPKAVARPAGDLLVLTVDRFPPPRLRY